jgi:transposase
MSKHGPITAAPMTWAECAAAGMTRKEAQEYHGVSATTALRKVKKLGLEFARGSRPYPLDGITREVLAPIISSRKTTIKQVAEMLGVTPAAVFHKARRLGLPYRTTSKKPVDENLFTEMWNMNVSGAEMQRHFGYKSSATVHKAVARLGLAKRPKYSKSGNITAAAALEAIMVRKMRDSAAEMKIVAKDRAKKARA